VEFSHPAVFSEDICYLFVDIPWPEGEDAISEGCREAIEALLIMDPSQRPGARGKYQLVIASQF